MLVNERKMPVGGIKFSILTDERDRYEIMKVFHFVGMACIELYIATGGVELYIGCVCVYLQCECMRFECY